MVSVPRNVRAGFNLYILLSAGNYIAMRLIPISSTK